MDQRLLTPGWGGELAQEELEFIQEELVRDKKLSFKWGFQPGKKRRPEWSIRNVAMWGHEDNRKENMKLARQRPKEITQTAIQSPKSRTETTTNQ